MEMTTAIGTFRLYAKMLQGHCHIRLEKGNHVFNKTIEQAFASLLKDLLRRKEKPIA
jgi:hypothetical protein